ncbi:uncharacterized protein LOC115928313 [Strongylocentrotus purpuratus]|uniref:FBD domain-containing protein n=1 Tax=Strongylocentrotus purpuratus TaxID=7668 RepID=A0A7M7PFZ8_STRPU|nr:uncharacterized protein LOC115928313 [Strongylocentrotus purpuratus]
MFDNVKRVTIMVVRPINSDVIQRIHLPGATELTIQPPEKSYAQPFYEEPTSLPNALLNISPQLVKVTLCDVYIGNRTVEQILVAFRSTHNLKHLETIRFIRCGTDKRMDDFTAVWNLYQFMEVKVEHGKPLGKRTSEQVDGILIDRFTQTTIAREDEITG